jgi:hypothetical protein
MEAEDEDEEEKDEEEEGEEGPGDELERAEDVDEEPKPRKIIKLVSDDKGGADDVIDDEGG